jgi:hypothetical protein
LAHLLRMLVEPALHVLAYNLTRVNIIGVQPLLAAMRA